MEWIQKIIEYANQYSDGLSFLYTLLAGVIAVLLFFAKPIYALIFSKKKEEAEVKTIINVNTLDIKAIKELILAASTVSQAQNEDEPQHGVITEQEVMQAAATLSQFRSILKPVKALTPEVFPAAMKVVKYEADKLLVITLDSSLGEKGCLAAFTIIHWTIFPGLAGAVLGQLFGEFGPSIGAVIGAVLGIANWFRLSRRGPYIKINFQKKNYALISVASSAWFETFPETDIHTVYEDNRWVAKARIAGYPVVTKTSTESQSDAEQEINDFLRALNWRMGKRISVAEGVFVEPPIAEVT